MRTLTSTVFIAAAAGFVFAHYGSTGTKASPSPLTGRAAAANFSLRYPSDWGRTTAPVVSRVSLQGTLALGPRQASGETLVVGTAHPAAPGTLPADLRSALPSAPSPQIVTLGGSAFYRYLDLVPSGQTASESIYVLPTTNGTITALCSASKRSDLFTSSCERVLGTMKVTLGRVMSLVPDAGYAFELNRILGQLNAARAAAGRGLRSSDVKVRAAAADRLAAADDRAASAAHHITSLSVSVANQPLEAALRMNADAYRGLASAALKQDPGAYQRADAQISRSSRALGAVYAQLRALGYRIG
ncbi:MAG TPA: hypothetical protein VG325_13860 [Solirubrobacteraceae bacterium]|nr:hypothetical protein [Solirubrobacteraceae bacterium]